MKIKSAGATRGSVPTHDSAFAANVVAVVVMLRTVNFRRDIDSNFSFAVASQLFPTVLYASLEVSLFFPLKTSDS